MEQPVARLHAGARMMHIAFDGGCFQQQILGGIYRVACGFLNAAKCRQPDLQVTLLCDPRQGEVREEALAGLTWRPAVTYAPIATSYDPPKPPPGVSDANVRFYVDGTIIPAELAEGRAIYRGPAPRAAFAILSRSAPVSTEDPRRTKGVRIETITIRSDHRTLIVRGTDRRLRIGFVDNDGPRWTDGAGFLPLALFECGDSDQPTIVEVDYTPHDRYPLLPGAGADLVERFHDRNATIERVRLIAEVAGNLRGRGCSAYFVNHFTPVILPGLINVAWAYDLIPILFPQYFHADARLNFNENLKVFAAADRVYAISRSTRDDLVANDVLQPEQVLAVGIAIGTKFGPPPTSRIGATLNKADLTSNGYIVCVSTLEPRKNHLRLLLAYAQLRRRLPGCPKLVLIGNVGWDVDHVLQYRTDAGLDDVVTLMSDVPEEELVCLYAGALFSVYPSVYEGFGLPILEAMAVGCPVLTSNRSSMVEIAGNAAALVDPYDIGAISGAMQRLIIDQSYRNNLSKLGTKRALDYSWDRTTDSILGDLVGLCDR